MLKGGIYALGWIYVLFAAIVEVFWVIGLKYSETLWEWAGTAIVIVLSFYFVIKEYERLPATNVYAAFTGSRLAVIVLIYFIVFGADLSLAKVIFIALIIIGVIGIKITTDDAKEKQDTVEQRVKLFG